MSYPKDHLPANRPQTWAEALDVVPPVLEEFKPLAIGSGKVIRTLRKSKVSNKSIDLLIKKHTSSDKYLKSLIEGEWRYSISGEAVEPIQVAHKVFAEALLYGSQER